jgi:hypothetical protein
MKSEGMGELRVLLVLEHFLGSTEHLDPAVFFEKSPSKHIPRYALYFPKISSKMLCLRANIENGYRE